MTFLTTFGVVCIFVLAMWKIHDLLFKDQESRKLKKAREVQNLLNVFFAEFTYKTMSSSKIYRPAPKEIYEWINLNFKEWSVSYMKRVIQELKDKN